MWKDGEALQADDEAEQRPGDRGARRRLRARVCVCPLHSNPRTFDGVFEELKGEH